MCDALLLEDPTAPDVPELCPFKYRVFFNCCPLKVSDYIVNLIKKKVSDFTLYVKSVQHAYFQAKFLTPYSPILFSL